MKKEHLWLPALLSVAIAFIPVHGHADDDNVSGLRGQRLKESRDTTNLIGALTSGGAKISKVEVVRDALRLVELDVTYVIKGQKTLRTEVLGRNKKRVPVRAAPVELSNASGSVRVVLEIDPSQAEGTSFESSRVVLRLDGGLESLTGAGAQSGSDTPAPPDGVIGALTGLLGGVAGGKAADLSPGFTFELVRQWAVPVRAENLVVNVTPTPIGNIPAAKPGTGGSIAPPKIFKLNVMPVAVRAGNFDARRIAIAPSSDLVTETPAPAPPPARPATAALDNRFAIARVASFQKLKTIDEVKGLPADLPDVEGPSQAVIPLFSRIVASPGAEVSNEKLTSISSDLFQDKNPNSGIYYYLPSRYTLYWNSDNGYAMRMCYGAAAGDEQGSVTISARLTSGIDLSEVDLLRKLLRAAIQPPAKFKDLRPFPIAAAPAFSLKGDLRQLNIPPEKVAVQEISDIAGQVDLLITTDTVTKETIEALLTQGNGLSGSATFTSAGEGGFSRNIPVQLRLADPRSFGPRYWKRGTDLRNTTPFPITLKYLHFLTMAPDGSPTVYSYNLGDARVPARAKAQIDAAPVQAWLDAEKGWIDYTVVERDDAGIATARQQFACGATQLTSSTLAISSLTPFAEPGGIARIVVEVSSRYFDAQAQNEQVKSVTLVGDNETKNLRLYLLNRTDSSSDALFKYRVSIVRPDGTRAGPSNWRTADELELFIGSSQITPLLGAS